MYETMNQPVPDIAAYLGRIGLGEAPSVDLAGLNALILAHQTHVPFEDLDVFLLKRPLSLEIPALFDKVVLKRRGGYCYELNALFTRLLLDLGFDARSVFCRVVRGRDFLPPCAHRGIVVALEDGLYFCDVGFGGPMPAGAVPVEDGGRAVVDGERFGVDRFDGDWWTLSRQTSGGEWEKVLQFNAFPQQPQEFLAANWWSETHPSSLFVNRLLVNLRTRKGSRSITGDAFTLREDGRTTTVGIPDRDALRSILHEQFGIDIL